MAELQQVREEDSWWERTDSLPRHEALPDTYLADFLREYDPYTCSRCGAPVLLSEKDRRGRRYYGNWNNGRPHFETCRARLEAKPEQKEDHS